jgi:ribosomal 30S subunit maturation factor RimM
MSDDILTIRCADWTRIKIPLNSTGIKSVDINGEIIWVNPMKIRSYEQ